jgi:hypothetical protein
MQQLIDELKNPAYKGLSDQQAADLINALTVRTRKLVDMYDVEEYARKQGIRVAIELAKANNESPCQAIAISILAYLTSPRTKRLDVDLPEVREMFVAMQNCGFATQDQVNELIAMGCEVIPWVQSIGLVDVTEYMVRQCRDIISGIAERRQSLREAASVRYNQHMTAIDSIKVGDPDPVL